MGKKSPIEKAIERRMRLILITPEDREKRNAKIRKMQKTTVVRIRAQHAWLVRQLALMDGEAEPLDEVERAVATSPDTKESLQLGYRAWILDHPMRGGTRRTRSHVGGDALRGLRAQQGSSAEDQQA